MYVYVLRRFSVLRYCRESYHEIVTFQYCYKYYSNTHCPSLQRHWCDSTSFFARCEYFSRLNYFLSLMHKRSENSACRVLVTLCLPCACYNFGVQAVLLPSTWMCYVLLSYQIFPCENIEHFVQAHSLMRILFKHWCDSTSFFARCEHFSRLN